MTKKIEKIYICRKKEEDKNIIEKVLIQYIDGSGVCFCLPSFYNELSKGKKKREKRKIEEHLEEYMDDLKKQDNSTNNYLENSKIILINEDDLELKEYVNFQIDNMLKKELKKTENTNIFSGLFSDTIAGVISTIPPLLVGTSIVSLGVLLNIILSSNNFLKAIKTNRMRNLAEKELKVIKSLKLYFSYLMLTINIGFGINNLKINYEDIMRDINHFTLCKTIDKQASILDNPFSDEELLVTTEDAKINLLMEAFNKNPFINEEDLEIAVSLKEYLEENPYINYEKLYETFATLGVIHSKDYDYKGVSGVYYPNTNIIEIFESGYKSEELYEDVFRHETIHSTGSLPNTLLNEGITALIQKEYSKNHSTNDSYYDHIIMTKIFCELIGPEKMLEAYTKMDMQIIKEEMLKINTNEEYYNNLMYSMQKYSEEYQDRYLKLLLSEGNIRQEDLPSYEFFNLLTPYLTSEKVDVDTKETIIYYLEHFGFWVDVDSKFYFNKEESVFAKSNQNQ